MDDKEFQRVLSNPDNFILSDSLADRLEIDASQEVETLVEFSCEKKVIFANFLNYKSFILKSKKQKAQISFICESDKLKDLVQINPGKDCFVSLLGQEFKGILKNLEIESLGLQIKVIVSFIKY